MPAIISVAITGSLPRKKDNSPELVDWLAAEMKAHGVKPEIEAFDLSMISQVATLPETSHA